MPHPEFDDEGLKGNCELCGERYDVMSPFPSLSEVAEFWVPKTLFATSPNYQRIFEEGGHTMHEEGFGIVVHGQCGLDAGLEMA